MNFEKLLLLRFFVSSAFLYASLSIIEYTWNEVAKTLNIDKSIERVPYCDETGIIRLRTDGSAINYDHYYMVL